MSAAVAAESPSTRSGGQRDRVQFGFMGGPSHDPVEIERWARHCEKLGASLLAAGEGATLFPDPYLWLHVAAQATSHLRLGAILTVPGVRHPAVLANTLATLQRLSGGRMFLGLGSGDLGRLELGLAPSTLAELEAYAVAVRDLSAGGAVDVGGATVQIRWAEPADRVPLMLGADGPRTQRLAGGIADAVVVGQAGQPDMVRHINRNLEVGARAAGRAPEDIEVWLMCRAHVSERDNGAIYTDGLDEYGARQAHYFWRTAGSPDEDDVIEAVHARKGLVLSEPIARSLVQYCSGFSAELGWTAGDKSMVERLEHYDLREWAGRMFYLSGPPDAITDRLHELVDAGGRNFVVPQMLGDRFEAAAAMAQIFDPLRTGGATRGKSA